VNNHFTVTIHDDNGVKQFNLHNFVKKVILYVFIFFAFVGVLGVATILYLDYAVEKIEQKRQDTQLAYEVLSLKNENLQQSIQNTQKELDAKKEELVAVSDSLTEIETMIGLSSIEDVPLLERANLTKVTSENMATLLQFIPNGSPVPYNGVTSKFGMRIHPTLGRQEMHRGSDLKAAMNTPVYATADGIVEYAGYHEKSGYGNLVILQHNYGFKTYYGHLNKVVIKSGTFVTKGTLLAYSGNSGMSNGPHLHYEIRFISRALNPFWFIKWNVQNYQEIFEKEQKIPWQSLITATAHIKVPQPTQIPQSLQPEVQLKGK
jgi:murein DD-endopeptidase MepM/ murein hydrolase activator NlpD